MAEPESLRALIEAARNLLVLRHEGRVADMWLWEHSERVMHLAQKICGLPDVAALEPDPTVVAVGALFHDAGWAVQVADGTLDHWKVLSRPTNDAQRDLAADALREYAGDLLPERVLHLTQEAIRQINDRVSSSPEARVIAEAENLDEIGLTYILRQFRQQQVEGRSLEQLLLSWRRQQEYAFWEARINDHLRFEGAKAAARRRLAAVDQFMDALAAEQEVSDL